MNREVAERVLERLYAEAVAEGLRNHARARLRQLSWLQRGAGLKQLATIWREEFKYLPEDRAREEMTNDRYSSRSSD